MPKKEIELRLRLLHLKLSQHLLVLEEYSPISTLSQLTIDLAFSGTVALIRDCEQQLRNLEPHSDFTQTRALNTEIV